MYIKKDASFVRTAAHRAADNMAEKMKITGGSIFLDNMKFRAFHGVMQQERRVGGDFAVSLNVRFNPEKAVESDDVDDTLNYAVIYDMVKQEMQQPSRLLENVAGRIGRRILETMPRAEAVDITVSKLNPPMGADAGCAGVRLHIEAGGDAFQGFER